MGLAAGLALGGGCGYALSALDSAICFYCRGPAVHVDRIDPSLPQYTHSPVGLPQRQSVHLIQAGVDELRFRRERRSRAAGGHRRRHLALHTMGHRLHCHALHFWLGGDRRCVHGPGLAERGAGWYTLRGSRTPRRSCRWGLCTTFAHSPHAATGTWH